MKDHLPIPKSHVFGAILLVAGCCIGAGMLGLPVLTSLAGFKPSLYMFILCWIFMFSTGLLLLEANLYFTDRISLISMAERTLGKAGKGVSWVVFAFLFYCLLVAYISGSGSLLASFIEMWFDKTLPQWLGSIIMTLALGLVLYLGTLAVDSFNRLLMLGLVISYVLLVGMGSPYVESKLLEYENWSASFLAVPAMIVSFGYHNLIPTLTQYLQRDRKILTWVIFVGSLIPLLLYITWNWLILGLVPVEGVNSFSQSLTEGEMATHTLKKACQQPCIIHLSHAFAFFALVTSFLGVALSFVDFLADGLSVERTPKGKAILCLLVLAPPLALALIYPSLFLKALGFAGGYGAIILFSVLPIAMVWSGRYYQKRGGLPLLPGGKPFLLFLGLISLLIMILQFVQG